MPWKAIRDPYRIWLSEIILQQTRVAQGLPYYERFVSAYPTVIALADADDDAVMKLWEGLGYYSRARNLLKAARVVANEHGGSFPTDYAGLLALPGVGPYTAAAIGSFAYDLPLAVLDGNVFRVLSRYANDATPIDESRSRKHYDKLAAAAMGTASARVYNQAIMDFGATVCTARNAGCKDCPLSSSCQARKVKTVYERPVKTKKLKKRTRYFHFLTVENEAEQTIVEQRTGKDIWRNLYQFPLVETTTNNLPTAGLATAAGWPKWLPAHELSFVRRSAPLQQQLTHQTIIAVFHHFTWKGMRADFPQIVVDKNKLLTKFAFPRLIVRYIEDKSLLLF